MKSAFSILLCVFCLAAKAEVSRIEPPFWWAGMNKDSLQLMLYGKDLAGSKVRSLSSAVEVSAVNSMDSNNYLFVDLELASSLRPGEIELEISKDDRTVEKLRYTFKERRPGSAQRQGFSSKDTIYLLTPDRFANGDSSNDNIDGLSEKVDRDNPVGRHGGDLQGITQHLDYLADLGITQLWMNPLQENNQPKYSYHGYSISDLYNVDARFGGNQALLQLSSSARDKGIGLIMDTVPNHIGLNHWWMKDLPAKNWINNDAEFAPTSHRRETIQDPHASQIDKREMTDHWFVPTMPDLNQHNPHLANYLIQNNIWWVEYADLTGLRVDTLPYGDKHFTARFNQALLREYPNLNIVGEEWSTNPANVSYWQRGKINQDGFEGHTPALMDFPLQEALIKGLTEEEAWFDGLIRIYQSLANDFQYPDSDNLVVIADNHDMSRIFTQLNEDYELFKMAMVFLVTTRGIPQIFYGTEILMSNPGTTEHGVIRSDYPGGWSGDKRNAFSGDGLSKRALETQKLIRKLLNWRKRSAVIHNGRLTQFSPKDGVYSYIRHDDKKMVVVIFNKNIEQVNFDTSRLAELTASMVIGTDVLTDKQYRWGADLLLPARSALILELE